MITYENILSIHYNAIGNNSLYYLLVDDIEEFARRVVLALQG
jgi:hypothetical protein